MMWPCFTETVIAGGIGSLLTTILYLRRERLMRDAYHAELDRIYKARRNDQ